MNVRFIFEFSEFNITPKSKISATIKLKNCRTLGNLLRDERKMWEDFMTGSSVQSKKKKKKKKGNNQVHNRLYALGREKQKRQ